MSKRSITAQIVLWLFVLSAGILLGGSIFEGMVLTPLWAGSLPESVTEWQYGSIQAKFFRIASPLYALFSLALIIASRRMPSPQRKWAAAAGVCGILVIIATFLFFLPILEKTQATRGAGLSGEEITRLVNRFTTWHWLRWAAIVASWIAGLRALSLSAPGEPRGQDAI
jgi:hypothetical protein